MNLNDDERAVVFLDSFSKLEYVYKMGLLKSLPRPSAIFHDNRLIERYFKSVGKELYAAAVIGAAKNAEVADGCVKAATAKADGVITYFSVGYPSAFKNIPEPPLAVYYRGNAKLLESAKKFSIVGSRKMLGEYLVKTEEVAFELSKAGVTIVTGIAVGGDKAAITGGIKGGNVISVFAGGVDGLHPASQANLVGKILEKGLIISEKPCGTPSLGYMYIMRNRLIAALGDGTLVVGGDEKSGTRYTAEFAIEYGKDVCCFPYGFGEAGRTCKTLINSGATIVENACDVAKLSGYKLEEQAASALTEEEQTVLDVILGGVTNTEEIISASPYPISKTIETLVKLEMKKRIMQNLDSYGTI